MPAPRSASPISARRSRSARRPATASTSGRTIPAGIRSSRRPTPGATAPVAHAAGGSIYTDSFNASVGTSFSAPLVAGTAALMLSAQPALVAVRGAHACCRPRRGRSRPRAATRGGTPVPQCTVPQFNGTTPVDQLQCYCTTATCGAGMLDAGAAVIAALGLQAHIGVSPGDPVAGQVVTLSAAPSVVAAGRSIVAYQWAIADGGGIVTGFAGAANGPTATRRRASGAGTLHRPPHRDRQHRALRDGGQRDRRVGARSRLSTSRGCGGTRRRDPKPAGASTSRTRAT